MPALDIQKSSAVIVLDTGDGQMQFKIDLPRKASTIEELAASISGKLVAIFEKATGAAVVSRQGEIDKLKAQVADLSAKLSPPPSEPKHIEKPKRAKE